MATTQAESVLRLQTDVLEAVARGRSLTDVGAMLCRQAEALADDLVCSILEVDEAGHVRPLAAPSLPQSYCAALDGVSIGPDVGSCGTAAWRGVPVTVTDIGNDPLWADFKHLALGIGLRACWSSPIFSSTGTVVGTFAFYYRTCRGPSDFERRLVDTCVDLCALAIEHERNRERDFRLAHIDPLTGLPNRIYFDRIVERRVADGEPLGLLYFDIDHLRRVNESHGHEGGDSLLRAVVANVLSCGEGLQLCRLDGDQFAVLVSGCDDHAALAHAARRLLNATGGLLDLGEGSVGVHITLGGAVLGEDGVTARDLCQNAECALAQAKKTHRGSYLRFTPQLRAAVFKRSAIVRQADRAIEEGRVLAHYQPIVRLDSGQIVGLEALARIALPDGRVATAGEFHEAFEDPRLAYDLTGCMLAQVARDVRNWLDAGMPFEHVGINVTTGDFQRGDLAERITDIFTAAGVPLTHLVLEVNEAVLMDGKDPLVPQSIEALRQQGLLVALDDFGTGFASLTHLLDFPVDIIKIDRSFVEKLGHHLPSDVLVGAIYDIARQLDMRVVAEGIERPDQVDNLRRLGGALGQGFLFSRPVSAAETTRLLDLFAQRPPASDGHRRSA